MLIEQDDFNNQSLFDVYSNAYMQPTQDDDGDVVLEIDGLRMRARVLPDRPFFVLSSGFGLKPEATRMQVLELCNRINDNLVMIRACLPEGVDHPVIYFDHYTMTKGGITGEEIVAATQRFMKVIRDGLSEYDVDDLI